MFVCIGKVINVVREKTKNDIAFTTIQVMSNGGGKMRIQNITDWDNRNWKVDQELKIPVFITAWSNGKNISVTAIKAQG